MKYTLTLDKDNYILSLAHTLNDDCELDISTIELKYLSCYFYNKDTCEAILDEAKKIAQVEKEEQEAKDTEIAELKKELYDTDYLVSRCFEEVMSLSNPLTFIADVITILKKYKEKYSETITNREAWRKRVEELEPKE